MGGLYLHETSALERVVAGIVFSFRGIHQDAGYRNTVGDIFTEIPDPGSIRNYPAVALLMGQTTVESMTHDEIAKIAPFTVQAYLQEGSSPTTARLSLLADFEKMLGGNWMGKGEDGVETCRLAEIAGYRPFVLVMNTSQIGFTFGFTVAMSQLVNDPSVSC